MSNILNFKTMGFKKMITMITKSIKSMQHYLNGKTKSIEQNSMVRLKSGVFIRIHKKHHKFGKNGQKWRKTKTYQKLILGFLISLYSFYNIYKEIYLKMFSFFNRK